MMSAMVITTREWNRISNDYKTDNDGKKAMLYYSPRHGTCSIPVRLDDESGLEYGKYRFRVHGAAYDVYAYSMAEALRIIRSCGHSAGKITGLEREFPYRQREQADIIGGRIVYVIGDRYEISDVEGLEVVFCGDCEPDASPREVYTMHFPLPDQERTASSHRTMFLGNQRMRAEA